MEKIEIADYNYELPEEKIAVFPLPRRDQSRLLVYDQGKIFDDRFYHLADHISSHSLIVLNDTRVIEARLRFTKTTGAEVEIFCLSPHGQSTAAAMQQQGSAIWECLIGGASKWKPGQVLIKDTATVQLEARYVDKTPDGFLIQFNWLPEDMRFADVLHHAGAMPLPPYIKRKAEETDSERYQTVFAREEGSVAAPTASLHFTPQVFDALKKKGISLSRLTLHVGAGTFKPVKTQFVSDHKMHGEPFSVSKRTINELMQHENIVAAGTTSLRTLESLFWTGVKIIHDQGDVHELKQWEAYELANVYHHTKNESLRAILEWMNGKKTEELHCRTNLIIVPGYDFKMAEGLITNFHQPQSTLLLLIAAFIGKEWRMIYDHALQQDYRFLSYGDGSLLWRKKSISVSKAVQ